MNEKTLEDTDGGRRVLLAGCGDLGSAVGARLTASGHRVTGVRRSRAHGSGPFRMLSMDLADPGDQSLPEADAVVVALAADSPDAESYERAYRRTLHGLAAALPRTPERVVLVSSTGVLGDRHGEVVTEQTDPAPTRSTAQVLLAAEQDAQNLFADVVVLRPAGIYGPGRTRTIDRVRAGRPADHGRITNRIHRDDLVTTIAALLEAADPPSLLHGVDTEPARLGDVVQFLAERLGVPIPADDGPEGTRGKILDGSRLHAFLGTEGLRFPTFREGYAALLSELSEGAGD